MKRTISIVLAFVALLALSFTGCGKDKQVSSNNLISSNISITSSINTIEPIVVEEYFDGKLKLIKSNDNSPLYGIKDSKNKIIIPTIYNTIYVLNENRISANIVGKTNADSKTCIFDSTGKIIKSDDEYINIEYKINPITGTYYPIGIATTSTELKFIVDFDGIFVRHFAFKDLSFNDDKTLKAKYFDNPTEYLIGFDGKLLSSQPTSPVIVKELFNGDFKITQIQCKDKNPVENVEDGQSLQGLIDKNGKVILKPKYEIVEILSKNRILAITPYPERGGTKAYIFDNNGNTISNNEYFLIKFYKSSETNESVGIGRKYNPTKEYEVACLVDFDGKKIVDTEFTSLKYNNDNKTFKASTTPKSPNLEFFTIDFSGKRVD